MLEFGLPIGSERGTPPEDNTMHDSPEYSRRRVVTDDVFAEHTDGSPTSAQHSPSDMPHSASPCFARSAAASDKTARTLYPPPHAAHGSYSIPCLSAPSWPSSNRQR